MRHPSPVQRLGRTANLVIFLGLLYTVLHLLGFPPLGRTIPALATKAAMLILEINWYPPAIRVQGHGS